MNERIDIFPQALHGQRSDGMANGQVLTLDAGADKVQSAVSRAAQALMARQAQDGHWRFSCEADVTIPAEYMLLHYFMGSVDKDREVRIAAFIRRRQLSSGSWSLYEGGPGDISATVKAYFALKLAGDAETAPHMVAARQWVKANGGAEKCNVFTRIALAMFGQMPWSTVPAMPVEMMLLPKWWFFHLSKVSYWSRCVIVPLLIIFAKRPVCAIDAERGVRELFIEDPATLGNLDRFRWKRGWKANAFLVIDRILKMVDPLIPGFIRGPALARAEHWLREHTKGVGGIGAIYPAIANAAVAFRLLGAANDDPDLVRSLQAIEDLVVDEKEDTWVQPCVSPIWDTCLSLSAMTEAGANPRQPAVQAATNWLLDQQVFVPGDWCDQAPGLTPGGWAFQYENDKYPDVDDTAMVLMALLRAGAQYNELKIKRLNQGVNWLIGMQSPDGGWGAFDIGNNYQYLNNIPFADHGALLDPSTADLTGRSIEVFAMLGYDTTFPPVARGLRFLEQDQDASGAWFGRWGVNYIYGTWSVLAGLGAIGEDVAKPYVRKAIDWLKRVQNEDGGRGESCNTYDDPMLKGRGVSTASQTAWALLGLMAVGETQSPQVKAGVEYLIRTQNERGEWDEDAYTGTGFPRVFYLRYHGYSKYFPLWALGTYARQRRGMPSREQEVIAQGPIDLGNLPAL